MLSGSLASNSVLDVKREKLLSGDCSSGGKVESQYKDMVIALETAREYGVPLTALVNQLYAALIARGSGALDHSSPVTLVEGWPSTESGEAKG